MVDDTEKIVKYQKVQIKPNQIPLYYKKYDISFLVELNWKDDQIEVSFEFDPSIKLTIEQKEEIAADAREELTKAFQVGDDILGTSQIEEF